jgi:hypothetical protein
MWRRMIEDTVSLYWPGDRLGGVGGRKGGRLELGANIYLSAEITSPLGITVIWRYADKEQGKRFQRTMGKKGGRVCQHTEYIFRR